LSLSDDVAVTKRALAAQDGPAILVGHSYGGAVISQAGNDPNVAALVYIAAFAPDSGESVSSLIQNPPPGAPVPPILPPVDGFLFLDRAKFHKSSHAVYVSQPKSVADLIAKASHGMTSAASRQSEETRHSRGRSRPVGVPDVICRRQTQ
jgi:pimeloyl-ACP methyl ester carboxylesterase